MTPRVCAGRAVSRRKSESGVAGEAVRAEREPPAETLKRRGGARAGETLQLGILGMVGAVGVAARRWVRPARQAVHGRQAGAEAQQMQ